MPLQVKEIIVPRYITPCRIMGYDYTINPYIGCPHRCVYCYAEFMKRANPGAPWGSFLDVKVQSRPCRPVRLQGKKVFLSSVTDCYNAWEEKYALTRRLLQQLARAGAQVTVLTKSPLVTRDIDVFQTLPGVTVGLSIGSLNPQLIKATEPDAPPVSERLHALETLHGHGIRTWVHMAPIFPQLSDWRAVCEAAAPFTEQFSFENLKLRFAALTRVQEYILREHPSLKALYDQIYVHRDFSYWEEQRQEILTYCQARGLSGRVYFSNQHLGDEAA